MSALTIIEPMSAADFESDAELFQPLSDIVPDVSPVAREKSSPVSLGILLVEDDPLVCELTRLTLVRAGYRVFTALTAEDAISVWKQHGWCVDLLLTDVFIPSSATGNDLAEMFLKEKPGLKVLFTSGFGMEVIPQQLTDNSDTAFIQKPFDTTAIIEAVHQVLAHRENPDSIIRDITRATV